ncbi:MAG: type II secretion system major pseudopilin GspG [Vulcanimicrobiota bacterium]
MKRRNEGADGFTFLEIIVVVVILLILAGRIVPRSTTRLGVGIGEIGEDGIRYEGKKTRAKLQMEEMAKSLCLYKLDNGVYPTTEQGLLALVEEPVDKPRPRKWKQYLDKVPYDPWSEPYLYKCPGTDREKNAAGYFRTKKEIYDPSPLSDMKTGSLAPHLRTDAEIYDNFVLTCTGADGVEGSQDDIRTVVDDESD